MRLRASLFEDARNLLFLCRSRRQSDLAMLDLQFQLILVAMESAINPIVLDRLKSQNTITVQTDAELYSAACMVRRPWRSLWLKVQYLQKQALAAKCYLICRQVMGR